MDAVELEIHRLNTQVYIAYKPTEIVLIPEVRTPQPSGGYKTSDGTPRQAQTFRIIEMNSQNVPVVRLQDGTQREAEFLLLGESKAVVQVNDHWTAMDAATGREREWSVAEVIRSNGYELRAMVVERGR